MSLYVTNINGKIIIVRAKNYKECLAVLKKQYVKLKVDWTRFNLGERCELYFLDPEGPKQVIVEYTNGNL